jgi:RHS repeat-associated protein
VNDAESRITQWAPNGRGLPTTIVRGATSAFAVTVGQTWDAAKPLPVTTTQPGRSTTVTYNTSDLVASVTEQDTTITTVPYSSNGQTRVTTFDYQAFTQAQVPTLNPTGTTLSDLPLTITNANGSLMTGLTVTTGSMSSSMTAPCSAADPCFLASSYNPTQVHRDILIPAGEVANVDAGRRSARVAWKQYSQSSGGFSAVRLLFLNQSGATIGSLASPLFRQLASSQRERIGPVPVGTRTIRVQMQTNVSVARLDNVGLTLQANGSATSTPFLAIVNSDALSAPATGWTTAAGTVVTATSDPCILNPCFKDSTSNALDSIRQDIVLPADRIAEIDAGHRAVFLEWIMRTTSGTTRPSVQIEFLDAANAVIPATTVTNIGAIDSDTTIMASLSGNVPPGARKIRLYLNYLHMLNGTNGSGMSAIVGKLVARSAPNTPVQLLASVNGPMAGTSDTTTYQYGTKGFLASVTNEVGHVTQITAVNTLGQPTSITDANLVVTNLSYNERNWVTTVTVNPGASQAVTSISYDAAGQVTRITLPDASYLNYTYAANRNVTLVTNNTGERVEYGYNSNGQVNSVTKRATAGGTITGQMTMVYDELGRLLRSIGAATQTTTFAYDRTDLNTQVTDPRSNLYAYAYDSLQRLIRETDQEGAQVNLTRNGQDDVVAYADPRNITTTYVRNGFGEVIQEASPDAGTTVYVRDARGLVTQQTDGRGVVTTMTYDNAGRLLTETYPAAAAENVTYTYDDILNGNKGKGRLTKVQDQSGTTELVYDVFGRVTSDKRTIAGKIYTTAYAYNAAGRVTQITYPSGRQVIISRNTNGQATGVTTKQNATAAVANIATGLAYRPMSDLITSMTHGNGLVTTAGYDLDYRLTNLQVLNGASVVQGKTYAYGDGMNLTGITDLVAASDNVALWHSPSNRLTSADGPWGQSTFSYDPTGNRTWHVNTVSAVTTARTQWYPANSNRMSDMTENGASFRVFTHDAAGNISQEVRPGAETFDYTYNNRNRMSGVTRNGVAYATYIYNALEQLASRNTSAPSGPVGTVHYIYDTDGHLIAEANAATGATTREYIWLPSNDNSNDTLSESILPPRGGGASRSEAEGAVDLPLALVEGTTLYQVHTDHLGRPTRITDAAKATVWQATWKPWGEVQSISGTILNNLRFPGQYFQIETGLAYNWHRTYDPVTGRYTQPDPLGFIDGPSVYAYAGNSPFMNVDRDGRVGLVGAVIGGGVNFTFQLLNNLAKGQNLRTALMCVDYFNVAVSAALGGVGLGVAGNIWKGNYASAAVGASVGTYVKTGMNPYKIGRPAGPALGPEGSALDGIFQ